MSNPPLPSSEAKSPPGKTVTMISNSIARAIKELHEKFDEEEEAKYAIPSEYKAKKKNEVGVRALAKVIKASPTLLNEATLIYNGARELDMPFRTNDNKDAAIRSYIKETGADGHLTEIFFVSTAEAAEEEAKKKEAEKKRKAASSKKKREAKAISLRKEAEAAAAESVKLIAEKAPFVKPPRISSRTSNIEDAPQISQADIGPGPGPTITSIQPEEKKKLPESKGVDFASGADAGVIINGLSSLIPAQYRNLLAGFGRVLTGELEMKKYITRNAIGGIALILSMVGQLKGLNAAQMKVIKTMSPVMGVAAYNLFKGEKKYFNKDGTTNPDVIIRELLIQPESKLARKPEDAGKDVPDSLDIKHTPRINRNRIYSALSAARGALSKRISEGKASASDLVEFDNEAKRIAFSKYADISDNQMKRIDNLVSAFSTGDLQESFRKLRQQLGALPPDAKNRELVMRNPELFKHPLLAYDTLNALKTEEKYSDEQHFDLIKAAFNAAVENKAGSLDAKKLIAKSMGGGDLVPGPAIKPEEIVAGAEDRGKQASNIVALSAGASAIAASLIGGTASTLAGAGAGIAAGSATAGGLAGASLAQAAGLSDAGIMGGAAVGGITGGVLGGVAAGKFLPKPIEIKGEPIKVEQQSDIKDADNATKGSGTLKPKFIVPGADAFLPTAEEVAADQVEFDMFDFIRPTAEGDGHTIAESNIKMSAYRNEQMRMNGGGISIAPMWGEEMEPITDRFIRAEMIGSDIPEDMLVLPSMTEDFGEFEVNEHVWNPTVGLQRAYAPQSTPVTGLNSTINESLLYGIVA